MNASYGFEHCIQVLLLWNQYGDTFYFTLLSLTNVFVQSCVYLQLLLTEAQRHFTEDQRCIPMPTVATNFSLDIYAMPIDQVDWESQSMC